MRRKSASAIAILAAAGIFGLGGCGNVVWWGTKKAATEVARGVGEKVGVTKSKVELRREIEEQRKEYRLREEKLRQELEKQRDEARKKEEALKRELENLKADFDRKIKELEKQSEEGL